MSNPLVIAAVTATLRELLDPAAQAVDNQAHASTSNPRDISASPGPPPPGVNIYLYQVTHSPARRNDDLPTRQESGARISAPRVFLDLDYLLSFYGDEKSFVPQRILGTVMSTIHAHPVLTPDDIGAITTGALAGADLDRATEPIRLTPLPLSLEELSKLWSIFFQTPYALSVAYRASTAIIEARPPVAAAPPVRRAVVTVVPMRKPEITGLSGVRANRPLAPGEPIQANDTLVITGHNLAAPDAKLRFDNREIVLPPGAAANERIGVPLSGPLFAADLLRAGLHTVQVLHPVPLGEPPSARPGVGFTSQPVPLLLLPVVTSAVAAGRALTLTLGHEVGDRQRAELLLTAVGGNSPPSFTVPADRPRATGSMLKFALPTSIPAGNYTVRALVDGVESLPERVSDVASPTGVRYRELEVRIP